MKYIFFTSCLLACMTCFAEQAPSSAPTMVYATPTCQKEYRAAFDLGSGLFKMVVAEIDSETRQINKILIKNLYAVMDKLNIDVVENYITSGNIKGLLATPELWKESD